MDDFLEVVDAGAVSERVAREPARVRRGLRGARADRGAAPRPVRRAVHRAAVAGPRRGVPQADHRERPTAPGAARLAAGAARQAPRRRPRRHPDPPRRPRAPSRRLLRTLTDHAHDGSLGSASVPSRVRRPDPRRRVVPDVHPPGPLGLAAAMHAAPFHHAPRSHVLGQREADDPIQPNAFESVSNSRLGGFRRVARAPSGSARPPIRSRPSRASPSRPPPA